jgi:aryl sulfotransferase
VMRHPADVAVSMSHFCGWDLKRSVAFLLKEKASMGQSNNQVRQYLGRWDNHIASWCEQTLLPVLTLRYEDLLIDPERHFQRLASFLGLPDKPELIAEAVANTSFEKLRAKEETEGGFHERPSGCERFFRSGKSGEGRKRLSDEQFHLLETSFSDTLQKYDYLS